MIKAIKANYIYYNGRLEKDKYLIFSDKVIAISETPQNAEKIIHKANSLIIPGLINTHTHLPMSFFRGLADDIPLMEWLQKHIWPAETKHLTEEFVFDATMLAAIEMIRSGTTCANDMYFYSNSIGQAIQRSGLKAVLGAGILDFPTKFGKNIDDYLSNAIKLKEMFEDDPKIKIALSPHAPYTVSPENYKKCISYAERYDMLIHTHLAETVGEVENILNNYGKTPVQLMNDIGLFDTKTIVAHMVHLYDVDIEIIGKKNVNISHCLESNLKLGSGFANIKKYIDAGANVSLGTDGAASNNDLDLLSEMSTVAKFHKGLNLDPTVLKAEEVLNLATKNAAKGLYLPNCGELKEGYDADFAIITFNNCFTTPLYNPISHLIYSAKTENVTDLYVCGKEIMSDSKIVSFDEEEVLEKARWWGNKIR
ncbi:MAG: amidohydrolase family protein [Calditerrivibrio sp.]|nr:amidohydrolase family protein [Calditerrivibrio sp.]